MQKDRIEVDVWAWGRGLESWLVDHIVIEGGPEHAETWDELGDAARPHLAACARRAARSARLAIDTGYEAPAVYAWARRPGHRAGRADQGRRGLQPGGPVVGPTYVDVTEGGKKLRRGARLWTVAVSTFKSETYRFLRLVGADRRGDRRGRRMPGGLRPSAALAPKPSG